MKLLPASSDTVEHELISLKTSIIDEKRFIKFRFDDALYMT